MYDGDSSGTAGSLALKQNLCSVGDTVMSVGYTLIRLKLIVCLFGKTISLIIYSSKNTLIEIIHTDFILKKF